MTALPQAASSPSNPRSIISRVSQPFKPKARNLTEFLIQLDEPYRHFAPGDSVKGSISLTIQKPLRVTHLVLRLHGFVKAFKDGNEAAATKKASFSGAGRDKQESDYFREGYASIFENEVVLCGEGKLNIGKYVFKFNLSLPLKNVPSSIDVSNPLIFPSTEIWITKQF